MWSRDGERTVWVAGLVLDARVSAPLPAVAARELSRHVVGVADDELVAVVRVCVRSRLVPLAEPFVSRKEITSNCFRSIKSTT